MTRVQEAHASITSSGIGGTCKKEIEKRCKVGEGNLSVINTRMVERVQGQALTHGVMSLL
jgi:hypothetical protein